MSLPQVETDAGRVEGVRIRTPNGPGLVRFLGIPYAAPPVGARRFAPPAPVARWSGVRPATEFGPGAPQSPGPPSRLPSFAVADWDEDCLTLNVWTPGLDGGRPVLVWLHGGAYLSGASAMPVFDGARLAAEGDAVVVTVNYRLGALGYLGFGADDAAAGAAANCGLRDQLRALEWVVTHAVAFGGDPTRITVFGESAGGGSVLHLLGSRARPPVRRAIVQSGEPRTLTTDLAARVRATMAARLGIDATGSGQVDALRAMPVDALLDAQRAVLVELGVATGLMPFHPTFDDDLVDLEPVAAFGAGRAHAIDLVIGTTRDELRLFADPRARELSREKLLDLLGRLAGGQVDPARILAAYDDDRPGRSPAEVWEAARTDAVLRVPALRVADAQRRAGGEARVYRFDWEAPGIGAAHAVDVPFVFGTFDRDGWGDAVGADARAELLSRHVRTAWCAFAATGDPAHDGIPGWPGHDPATRPTLLLDAECRI
ncbi:MAG: carboxylesterase/lipase family protein, partial [Actinomycetota bacterium]